ncbi:class I SAM-dependent methyltransferase [Yoonia sp. GPGPB17]|uniref:class I SAM-dependent methyltransferase n=1 Tax=Yoonia sp. GPGPB17 TaxID=3026147 RepID=UPI0030C197E6
MTNFNRPNVLFPAYVDQPKSLERLWKRWQMIIEPIQPDLVGMRVLDIAAHDGRWAYAFSCSGATSIVAIEARQALVDQFSSYPDDELKASVDFKCQEVFTYLDSAVRGNETFDVVAILGFLYHTMDHHRLFDLIRQLRPKLIIIDSEFLNANNAVIQITGERTDNPLNAAPYFAGQEKALVGTPSVGAMERFAESIGYDVFGSTRLKTNKAIRPGYETTIAAVESSVEFVIWCKNASPQATLHQNRPTKSQT